MPNKGFSSGLQVFLKGTVFSFLGALVLGVVNYLIRRHLAITLKPVDFGFFYSMFALYNLLTTFFQFGVKQASTVLTASYIAKKQEKRIDTLISSLLLFCVISGFVLMTILICGRNLLAIHFFKYPGAAAAIAVFAPFVLLNPIWSIFVSVPHAKLNFPVYNGLTVLQMLLVLAGVWIFAGPELLPMLGAWICAIVLALAAAIAVVCRKYRLRISPRLARGSRMAGKIWSLCSWMSGSMAGIMVLSNLDSFCLTWLSDLKQVAAYNIALPIMQILQTLMVLPLVFLPLAAKMWEERKISELRRIFLIVNTALVVCTIPTAFFFHWAGEWIISVMFGARFTGSAPALTILAAGILFYVVGQFNLNFLNSTGRQKIGMFIVVLTVLCDFLLNLLLIPKFGFCGAAGALSLSYALVAVLTFLPSLKQLSISE